MRIGFCTNMIATQPDGTGAEHLPRLAALGFDYAELPLAETAALDETAFTALRHGLREAGIPCEACNNFFPKTFRLTGPTVDDEAVDRYMRRALARAAALGARVVVFGSGPAKHLPPGFPVEEGFRQVAALLHRAGAIAEGLGITIAIEPLRRQECNLINTFAEGCRLAEAAQSPQVGVLVDYYHLRSENDPPDNLRQLAPRWLQHVHFARFEARGYPAATAEDAHYAPFFAALRQADYDNRLSLEAIPGSFTAEAPRALAFLREMTQHQTF